MDDAICYGPIWDGLLVDFSFDIPGVEWALAGVYVLCGVPRFQQSYSTVQGIR